MVDRPKRKQHKHNKVMQQYMLGGKHRQPRDEIKFYGAGHE